MYTDWAFTNDFHEDWRQSIEILKSKSFRFMLQMNKNVFYEYYNDKDYHYLWGWGVIWDKRHRNNRKSIPINTWGF